MAACLHELVTFVVLVIIVVIVVVVVIIVVVVVGSMAKRHKAVFRFDFLKFLNPNKFV